METVWKRPALTAAGSSVSVLWGELGRFAQLFQVGTGRWQMRGSRSFLPWI